MIPHPVTWQNAREGARQDVLAAAERDRRESRGALHPSRPSAPAGPTVDRMATIESNSTVHYTTRVASLRLLDRLFAMLA